MKGQKVYTEIVCSWTGEVLKAKWFEYAGPVAVCKGSDVAKKTLEQQTALQQQTLNTLNAKQKLVQDSVSKYLTGAGQGFDPQQLALLRSQFLNSNAAQYNQAGRATRTALLRSGSADSTVPAGGDYVRGISGLEGAEASNASQGLTNIGLQDLQQALANKFNAVNAINSQAATLTSPISTFGSGLNNALNQYVYAANQGFGSAFAQGFGGALGKGLGAGISTFATGGLGLLGQMAGFPKPTGSQS